MNDVLEQREGSLDEYRKEISLNGDGTGAAFFVNGIFQGIELFDREATFGKALHYGPDLTRFAKVKGLALAPPAYPELLLTRYALERFLYRLGISKYRGTFVLKGAMLYLLLWRCAVSL